MITPNGWGRSRAADRRRRPPNTKQQQTKNQKKRHGDGHDSANFRCLVLPSPCRTCQPMQGSVRGGVGCVRAVSAVDFGVRGRGGRGNLGTWGDVAEQAAVCCPQLFLEGDDNVVAGGGVVYSPWNVFRRVAVEFGPGRTRDGVRFAAARARWPGCVNSRRRTVILLLRRTCLEARGRATLCWDNVRRVLVEFRPGRRRFGARSAMQRAQ